MSDILTAEQVDEMLGRNELFYDNLERVQEYVEALRQAWNDACVEGDEHLAEVERLKAEGAAHAAIVEKLPRTKDGVPITPAMTLYVDTGFGINAISEMRMVARKEFDGTTPSIELITAEQNQTAFGATKCYSTRAAAEAALAAGKDRNE